MSFKSGKSLSMSFKLVTLLGFLSFLAILGTSIVSYLKSKNALQQMAQDQLVSMGETMKKQVEHYSDNTKNYTNRLASDRLIEGLFLSYESAFYGEGFAPGEDLVIEKEEYLKLHADYSERTLKMLEDFKLSNFYLMTLDQQIVFSAKNDIKGNILGRNFESGLLKSTQLAKCAESALNDESGKQFFSEYEFLQILGNTAAFVCQKVFAEFDHLSEGIKKGDVMGVIVTELDLAYINQIVTQRIGMGETGQAYLVGDDKLLRSDFFIDKDKFNVNRSMSEKIEINTSSVSQTREGKSGFHYEVDPNGHEALSYYNALSFMGEKWIIIAEKQESEIFAPVKSMMVFISITAIVIFLSMLTLAYFAIQRMISPLIKANETLNEISNEVSVSASSIGEDSKILSESSTEVTSSLQTTVATLDELTAMVNKNLENVNSSSEKAGDCNKVAKRGKESINLMIGAMNEIDSSNEEIIEEMNGISTKLTSIINVINEIDTKTAVINDIVFQTKLLSFNASVEAARAGVHGKGFAVVAEEVGNLAVASGKAAQEISTMLDDSVVKVKAIVDDTNLKIGIITEQGKKKVDQGLSQAHECGQVLDDVLDNVNEVNCSIQEISIASNEQAGGIQDLFKSMKSLDKISNQTNKIANETLSSTNHLGGSATQLLDIVSNLVNLVHGEESRKSVVENKDETISMVEENHLESIDKAS